MPNAQEARVLVVDDQLATVAFVNLLVKKAGALPLQAESAQEALQLAEKEHPVLILLDHYMPEISGEQCCRMLKTHDDPATRNIPVIMVTSAVDLEEVKRCFLAGCDDYVTKPIHQTQLTEKIRTIREAHEKYGDQPAQVRRFNRKILLAGSKEHANQILEENLVKFGYEVHRATTADETHQALSAREESFDLLILGFFSQDLHLQLLQALQSQKLLSRLSVVLMGGSDAPAREGAEAFADYPIALYMEKELPVDEMLFRVNHLFFSNGTREIRNTPRIPAVLLVKYQFGGVTYQGYSYNLSKDGIFIRTVNPPEPGTAVDVSFSLPGDDDRVSGQGTVVWRQDYVPYNMRFSYPGMGVHLGGLSVIDEDKLIRYIQKHLIPESY